VTGSTCRGFLHTGTGTAQTTAISTAAITAVIFSLVDRSMASSERDPTSAPPIRGLSRLRCDGDHAPTGCLLCLPARPACRVWLAPGPSAAAQNLRRALLTPLHGSRERRPMKRRDISITTGVAVLAMQVAFLVALHFILH
jgi:hypothetical protein